jgi:hypothetical protein
MTEKEQLLTEIELLNKAICELKQLISFYKSPKVPPGDQ